MTTTIPPLTPYLTVSNAAAAIDFYKRAFAATQDGDTHTMPGTDKIMHARLLINGSLIMLADDFSAQMGGPGSTPEALGGSPIVLALDVEDIDTLWNQAAAAGATITMPLADMFWGARYGQMTDPFGHKWSMSKTLANMDDKQMQDAAEKAVAEKGTLMGEPV